ncbi:hypothetical protein GA0115235_1084100 [Streptomyces sp. DpondAA-F4a]|nr:hypothetical protein GA0115235_1084100 [Streptomyces sp. DpondAA-F4a]SCL93630.1 hypothetical protein SAMN04883147_1039119 [Streptomyces sp. DpondAA-F4]
MNMSTTTATAIHGLKWYADTPAMDSTRRTSPGAYATEESGSDANTGRAMRLGRSVSPSLSLRSAWPIRIRFGTSVSLDTLRIVSAAGRGEWATTP